MKVNVATIALAAALVTLGACDSGDRPGNAQTSEAAEKAGDKTIASGLPANGKFIEAAKAAGIDQTLAGPGPYTVFVAEDAAFEALPDGAYDSWMKPENRAELVGAMTYMVLPGTVLSDDIGKAIDKAEGKAEFITMGGGVITATKEGGAIILTDGAGRKARVTKADDTYSNGVVHYVDGVLLPKSG